MELTMHPDEYANMANHEQTHWWYRSLHQLVLAQIEKHFTSKEIRIADGGCGTGGLILFLREKGYKHVKGFDKSVTAVQMAQKKNLDVFEGDLNKVATYFEEDSIDVFISNDTFYFLNHLQQLKATDSISRLLRENGLLILNIPSLKIFRGIHDERVGIGERLARKDVSRIFDNRKYQVVSKIYWPFFLSPFIGLARFVQRFKMKFNKELTIKSDVRDENKVVNSILYSVTSFENTLLKAKPFGSSLLIVLKKKLYSYGKE